MSAFKDLQVSKQVFHRAVAMMEEIFESVRVEISVPIDNVEAATEVLLQHLESDDALLVQFLSAGGRPMSPAEDVVNVCILSLKVGMELDYPRDELRHLGLASLLHDVGTARIPKRLREGTDPLRPAEQAALQRRLEEGTRLLRGLGSAYKELADVVLQVQERMDGSGQPMGFKDAQIHEHAQIVGLAHIYQSLAQHRPARPRLWPPEALKETVHRGRTRFPDKVLKALIRVLATLPVGGLVRLNSGEIGQVVAKNEGSPLRPVVTILVRRGRRLPEPTLINLLQNPLLHVQEFLAADVVDAEVEGGAP